MNRRHFLTYTAAAGAALGTAGANDRIQLGIIGAGPRGSQLAARLAAYGMTAGACRVVAVADIVAQRSDIESQRHTCDGYRDYRDVIARRDVDAVVVATPDRSHVGIALEALRNGKDVYLETPACRDIGEAALLAATVRRTGRVLQVGAQAVSAGEWRKARQLIARGAIGRLVMSQGSTGSKTDFFPIVAALNLCWPAAQFPRRVSTLEREDAFSLIADFPQGHTLVLNSSPDGSRRILIRGDLGTVVVDGRRLAVIPGRGSARTTGIPVQGNDATAAHLEEFLECVRSRRRPALDAEAALRAQVTVSLATESRRQGRTLYWNEKTMNATVTLEA